jgi:hypothetical protein
MEGYMNYLPILGILNDYSDEKLEEITKNYKKQLDYSYKNLKKAEESYNFFFRHVNAFEEIKKERKNRNLEKEFKLQKEHLLLLSRMNFQNFENGGGLVCLGVEGKRPFGNSNIDKDISEILDLKNKENEYGDYLGYDSERVHKLLEELPIAINYIMDRVLKKFN